MTLTDHDIVAPAPDELIVVVGPTASGKTELGIRLAERFDGEVIGADSVQIYERFDIGSGKPTKEELARAKHHLVSVVPPLAPMDAGRFVKLADQVIADVRARGKVPIVCGGTFLWVKALCRGLSEAPRDEEIRRGHAAIAEREGRPKLHEMLKLVDEMSAEKLAPNDFVRVSRALEVFELTGKPLSVWHAEHGFREARHRARFIGVAREREEIDRRIEARAAAWIEQGWIQEVEALMRDGFTDARALGSVGYREIKDNVEGKLSREELLPTIVRSTRVFVRRQRTWLRDEPVAWVTLS